VFDVHLCTCPVGAGSFFVGENILDMKLITELCLVPKGNKEYSFTSTHQYVCMVWLLTTTQE